jgi:hypothetical protein
MSGQDCTHHRSANRDSQHTALLTSQHGSPPAIGGEIATKQMTLIIHFLSLSLFSPQHQADANIAVLVVIIENHPELVI